MKKSVLWMVAWASGLGSGLARGETPVERAAEPVRAAVVSTAGVQSDAEWCAVAETLADKWRARGFAVTSVAATNALARLREVRPTYTAFVARPDEATFSYVRGLHRLVQALDGDPFEDTVWGVVTGPSAADARRVAAAQAPDLSSVLSTTGIDPKRFTDLVTISDANPPGGIVSRRNGGEVVRRQVEGDTTSIFADAWAQIDPGIVVTSSHASEYNLEMPFSRGNIVPWGGAFWTRPHAQLIDYGTGRSVGPAERGVAPLAAGRRSRVWLAPGNCLIANNTGTNSMVMTALGFGRCDQFTGYLVTTWYGSVGWGTLGKWLAGGRTLGEAYHAAVNDAIARAHEICPGQHLFWVEAETAEQFSERFMPACTQFMRGQTSFGRSVEDPNVVRDLVGSLWDRDTTVLYGDPALPSALPVQK